MITEYVRHRRSGRFGIIVRRATEPVRMKKRLSVVFKSPLPRRYAYVEVPTGTREFLEVRRWLDKHCRPATFEEYRLFAQKQGVELSMP